MTEGIRYRVLVRDPRVQNFLASGRSGADVTGKATSEEIVERLKAEFGEDSFDEAGTLQWLEAQAPADEGESAVLPLNESHELEIVVQAS